MACRPPRPSNVKTSFRRSSEAASTVWLYLGVALITSRVPPHHLRFLALAPAAPDRKSWDDDCPHCVPKGVYL